MYNTGPRHRGGGGRFWVLDLRWGSLSSNWSIPSKDPEHRLDQLCCVNRNLGIAAPGVKRTSYKIIINVTVVSDFLNRTVSFH